MPGLPEAGVRRVTSPPTGTARAAVRRRRLPLLGVSLGCLLLARGALADDVLVIDTRAEPPEWALLQRELMAANAAGAHAFMEKYVDDRGYLRHTERWGGNDGPDDAMENFHNWPLAYALGAPQSLLDDYSRAWEGHLLQFTEARAEGIPAAANGMYEREFITSFDWEHTGEGLQAFFFYGLCRPDDPKYRERVVRFAGFYNGDDPLAPNYDPEHRVIRSLHNGSRGPKMTPATEQDWGGLPVPGEPGRLTRYSTASEVAGDHPLNLLSTTLGTTAYMLTGERKYRDWVLEYAGAWRDRILANGGNVPTRVGLDGTIGGEGGKWYDGVFGWNFWPQESGRNYFMRGPRVAMGNGLLLSGDLGWIEPLRRQMANLHAVRRVENGQVLLPNKHGDDGWYGYVPNRHRNVELDIYLWSLGESDKERVSDLPWIAYLDGRDPGYPAAALREALEQARERMRRIGQDSSDPAARRSDYFADLNPVATTALVNLALGGNDPGTPGNLLHSRLRYFDPLRRRAGLPEDVAALVSRITTDGVTLTLVNVSRTRAREVIVQAGAYGEHRFTTVTLDGRTTQVGEAVMAVRLAPGSAGELAIGIERYVNQPALIFPWDRPAP
jgi:hypothetical protein